MLAAAFAGGLPPPTPGAAAAAAAAPSVPPAACCSGAPAPAASCSTASATAPPSAAIATLTHDGLVLGKLAPAALTNFFVEPEYCLWGVAPTPRVTRSSAWHWDAGPSCGSWRRGVGSCTGDSLLAWANSAARQNSPIEDVLMRRLCCGCGGTDRLHALRPLPARVHPPAAQRARTRCCCSRCPGASVCARSCGGGARQHWVIESGPLTAMCATRACAAQARGGGRWRRPRGQDGGAPARARRGRGALLSAATGRVQQICPPGLAGAPERLAGWRRGLVACQPPLVAGRAKGSSGRATGSRTTATGAARQAAE